MKFKNGFYAEVCNKGEMKGIRIWSKDIAGMQGIAKQYASYKDVILLGEFKDGAPFRN